MYKKNVLITNFEIMQYSGSEINVITLAKKFKDLNYEVYILSLNFGEPLIKEIENEGYHFININEQKFDFNNFIFDIIWSQHSFILDWLIFTTNLKAKKVIISSLSPFEAFESVSDFANDMNIVLANSCETKNQLISEGINNVTLFENSAPKDFFNNDVKIQNLEKIAIVSNHIPDELIKVREDLINSGKAVHIYGLSGERTLINKEVLNNYDLIITIGKTVQFCMALKIPVYVYDRFGGCGYITKENIDLNRKNNFSGRGFSFKSESAITDDIVSNFEQAKLNLEFLYKYAIDNFCFDNIFDKILNKVLNDDKYIDFDIIRKENKKVERKKKIFHSFFKYSYESGYSKGKEYYKPELDLYKSDNLVLKNELKKAQNLNDEYSKKIIELEDKLNVIYNSRTWKIMNKIKKLKIK